MNSYTRQYFLKKTVKKTFSSFCKAKSFGLTFSLNRIKEDNAFNWILISLFQRGSPLIYIINCVMYMYAIMKTLCLLGYQIMLLGTWCTVAQAAKCMSCHKSRNASNSIDCWKTYIQGVFIQLRGFFVLSTWFQNPLSKSSKILHKVQLEKQLLV